MALTDLALSPTQIGGLDLPFGSAEPLELRGTLAPRENGTPMISSERGASSLQNFSFGQPPPKENGAGQNFR